MILVNLVFRAAHACADTRTVGELPGRVEEPGQGVRVHDRLREDELARHGETEHGKRVVEDDVTVPLFPQVEGAQNPIQPVAAAEDVDLLGERVDGGVVPDVEEGHIREVPVGHYEVVEVLPAQ